MHALSERHTVQAACWGLTCRQHEQQASQSEPCFRAQLIQSQHTDANPKRLNFQARLQQKIAGELFELYTTYAAASLP